MRFLIDLDNHIVKLDYLNLIYFNKIVILPSPSFEPKAGDVHKLKYMTRGLETL